MKSADALLFANDAIKDFEKRDKDNRITLEDKIQIFRTAAIVIDEELLAKNQKKYRVILCNQIKRGGK
jgi:hypothetical protein